MSQLLGIGFTSPKQIPVGNYLYPQYLGDVQLGHLPTPVPTYVVYDIVLPHIC